MISAAPENLRRYMVLISNLLMGRDNWIDLYCTYENFAKRVNSLSKYNRNYRAWFMGSF
jgi:hypothetical protein